MRYYEENFDDATAVFDANPRNAVRLLFRKPDPAGVGHPSATAFTRIQGGWFGSLDEAPEFPRDPDVVTEEDLDEYAEHLERNGFFGPNAYYMNHARNASYAESVANDGVLEMPALFVHATYDYVLPTTTTELAAPMREYCRDLTEETIQSGHWVAQEQPAALNSALARWLAARVPHLPR